MVDKGTAWGVDLDVNLQHRTGTTPFFPTESRAVVFFATSYAQATVIRHNKPNTIDRGK